MNLFKMVFILLSLNSATQAVANEACNEPQQPKVVKALENWSIIADNVADIQTAAYFGGPMLSYSISYNEIKPENKISIDKASGEITVDAQTRDTIDVKVTASNACGSVSNNFNIQIDQEEQ